MDKINQTDETQEKLDYPVRTVKIVAEMPHDDEMSDELQEMKENDGYSDSCGINPQT
ncbi:hypothetical protein [Cohnella silvisoli]|uniref:Uncharacterized protein n=1 Tax=Cohnella silvisoli TaxID=2873699 RepID=A0ABV1KZ11_9BACL|nr:hypothetical protein [Cohnella silvisoli]MCD9024287.1 hypothetical protein [Cohnella silvisoli]